MAHFNACPSSLRPTVTVAEKEKKRIEWTTPLRIQYREDRDDPTLGPSFLWAVADWCMHQHCGIYVACSNRLRAHPLNTMLIWNQQMS